MLMHIQQEAISKFLKLKSKLFHLRRKWIVQVYYHIAVLPGAKTI